MESVVDAVVEQTDGGRIAVVRLEIGELAGVAIDALRFCFDVCAKGTPLDGAALDVVAIGGRAKCRACGSEHAVNRLGVPCACGSFDQQLVAGTELRLKEVEMI
jgi:hydrogenase nickel incorporation protein HypA/HybF